MTPIVLPIPTVHFFSQFVYLDLPSSNRSIATVEELSSWYTDTPEGQAALEKRFGSLSREYELWKRYLSEDASHFSEWRIIDIFDDNKPLQTGFYGCTFLGPAGERVIAFRGSEQLGKQQHRNDYENDFAISYQFPVPQQSRVDDYWARFGLDDYGAGLAVTGHSLGGNLALYGAIHAPERIRLWLGSCISFNAPGFCKEFIAANKDRIAGVADKLILYQNKYDIISSLLENARSLLLQDPNLILSRMVPPPYRIIYIHIPTSCIGLMKRKNQNLNRTGRNRSCARLSMRFPICFCSCRSVYAGTSAH